MHLYGFLMPPWSSLIIFMFLGWNFLVSCSLCQSWQKRGEIVEYMWFLFKILHVRRRNTCLCKGEMCFILLRGVLTSFFLYTGLMTMFTYIELIFDIYLYADVCLLHLPLHLFFLFSLYTHIFLFVCNLLFLFHIKMPWWILFKVFQKYRLSKSSLPWTLFLQSFLRVCVRIDFILFNKWIWVEWFMTSIICLFVCYGLVTDCQRGRLLGYMCFTC